MGGPLHINYFSSTLTAHGFNACGKAILLIQNDLGDIISIREMLGVSRENSEFELVHADSLSMGLRFLRTVRFDVVLLDLELPDSQGLDTLVKLHQAYPEIPTVVLTDISDETFAVQLVNNGAQAFLVKGNINASWLRSTLTLSITKAKCSKQQHQQRLEQSNQTLHRQMDACLEEISRLREELKNLSTLAATDGLTGITNRYGFEQCLEREWVQAYRTQQPLSLIMIDLDYFKQFNDGYGHLQGDSCLRRVAQTLQERLGHHRQGTVARYGGEEFVAILPNTPVQSAVKVAETLRTGIQALAIRHPNSTISRWVTASLGIASTVPSSDITSADLVHEADQALYCSKNQGRDRIAYFQYPRMSHEPSFIRR